MGMNCTVNATW